MAAQMTSVLTEKTLQRSSPLSPHHLRQNQQSVPCSKQRLDLSSCLDYHQRTLTQIYGLISTRFSFARIDINELINNLSLVAKELKYRTCNLCEAILESNNKVLLILLVYRLLRLVVERKHRSALWYIFIKSLE